LSFNRSLLCLLVSSRPGSPNQRIHYLAKSCLVCCQSPLSSDQHIPLEMSSSHDTSDLGRSGGEECIEAYPHSSLPSSSERDQDQSSEEATIEPSIHGSSLSPCEFDNDMLSGGATIEPSSPSPSLFKSKHNRSSAEPTIRLSLDISSPSSSQSFHDRLGKKSTIESSLDGSSPSLSRSGRNRSSEETIIEPSVHRSLPPPTISTSDSPNVLHNSNDDSLEWLLSDPIQQRQIVINFDEGKLSCRLSLASLFLVLSLGILCIIWAAHIVSPGCKGKKPWWLVELGCKEEKWKGFDFSAFSRDVKKASWIKELSTLLLSGIVTIVTEITGSVHTVIQKSVLARKNKLEFNANLRLWYRKGHWMDVNGIVPVILYTLSLVVAYAASSNCLVDADPTVLKTPTEFWSEYPVIMMSYVPWLVLGKTRWLCYRSTAHCDLQGYV
jgi:hypothetical protein